MSEFVQLSETQFKIPLKSFTAFKLSLDDAKSISETLKCILLGKIPDLWFEEETTGFVRAVLKMSKRLVKKNLTGAVGSVHRNVRGGNRGNGGPRILNSDVFDVIFKGVGDEGQNGSDGSDSELDVQIDGYSSAESEAYSFQEDDLYDLLNPNQYTSFFYKASDPGRQFKESADIQALNLLHYNRPSSDVESEGGMEFVDAIGDDSYADDLQCDELAVNRFHGTEAQIERARLSAILPDVSESIVSSAVGTSVEDLSAVAEVPVEKSVKFSGVKNPKKSSRISIVTHQPSENKHNNLLVKRINVKDGPRVVKGVVKLAKRTKKSTKKSKLDFKQMVIKNILRRFNDGETIKFDKMLVLVKVANSVNQKFHFSENEPCETRIQERWREYLVVLRKCDHATSSIEINFYDVAKREAEQEFKHPEISFPLNHNEVKVLFYSIVDKTISISVSSPHHDDGKTHIYILQCHDQFTSYRWLFFLKEILNYKMSGLFQIKIPMLALSCDITIPNEILKTLHKTDAEEYLIVNKLPSKSGLIGGGGGYSVEYSGLINYLKTVLLSRVKEFERLTTRKHDMRESIEKNHELWLCYRYYDRLEWAHQNSHVLYLQNLLKSQDYQLELRERTHSPRKTTDPKGRVLFEPTPIEGFLARLTDIFGDARSFIKKYYRILYFYSCDNILFYSKFYRGMPPSPNNFLINEIDLQLCDGIEQGTGLHKLANQIPQVYEHSPFPLNSEGYIKWLNESEFMINDQHAYIEMLRRTQQIVKSEGLINMCKIKQIRKVPFEDISFADRRLQQLFWYLQESDIEDESITDSVLEVEMIHGARIRLQAPNRNIRDEWINRLYELKTYWSYRKSDDLNKLLQVRQQNKNQLEINDYTDSNISAEAGKVELSNSIAHASIYNMDCMSITKYVLMSGYLYQKPKKHANFTQYFVTLCPGFLMLFRVSRRSKVTGMIKETSCYEHYMTIPLDRCYIYSGETSSLDLLLRHKEFDSQNPGQHSLPRVYPDGWRSVEEEPVRCFSLWVGKRKNLKYKVQNESTSTSVRSTAPKNPGIVSFYRKLGFTGKKIMFLARSRQERELWVTRIMTEIDRTASNEGFS